MGLGTYFTGIAREAADIPHAVGTYIKGTVPQQFRGVLNALPHRGGGMASDGAGRLGNAINAKENLNRQLGDLGGAILQGRKETTSSGGINGTTWSPGVKRYTDNYKVDNGPSNRR
jgi:hypothetical protein